MNSYRYCKVCGNKIVVDYKQKTYPCSNCKKEYTVTELFSGLEIEARVEQLKFMNQLMLLSNNVHLYYHNWAHLVPEAATEEQFMMIALDSVQYHKCCDKFAQLVQNQTMRW